MDWDEIVQKSKKMVVSYILILKEEMQKATLASLSRMNAFNHIVLQGGTALRIFYNSPRFSEDLDFVLKDGGTFELASKSGEIERYLSSEFYYLQGIRVNIQKNTKEIQRMVIRTIPEIPSQKLRINIELFSVPSYHNTPKILAYPPLNPVIRVEERGEILADKTIAIAFRKYLKGRDIWDIFYLTGELNVSTSRELLEKKAKDYGVRDFRERIEESREKLLKHGVEALDREMKRFLPTSAYDQLKNSFEDIVKSVVLEILRYAGKEGLR